MKLATKLLIISLFTSFITLGQITNNGPSDFVGAGISYSPGATPPIAGSGLYAHRLTDTNSTYAFTVIDALPTTLKPFIVTTQVAAGIAQKVYSNNKLVV